MKRLVELCAVSFLLLAGCSEKAAPTAAGGAGPEIVIDHASPKALATSLHRAIEVKDYDGIAQCIAPEYRRDFLAVLDASRDYTLEMNRTADLIAAKIGPQPAARLRREAEATFRELLPSPVGKAVDKGKIDWNRIEIQVEDNHALLMVDKKYTPFAENFFITRVGGVWYASPNDDVETFAQNSKGLVRNYREFIKVLQRKQAAIKKGHINAQNVTREFWTTTDSQPTE